MRDEKYIDGIARAMGRGIRRRLHKILNRKKTGLPGNIKKHVCVGFEKVLGETFGAADLSLHKVLECLQERSPVLQGISPTATVNRRSRNWARF